MSRIRTIKPEFWISEQVMECSHPARLLFIGLWNFCDDNGVHPASIKTLKAEVFPGDDLTAADVQTFVAELLTQGLIAEFPADDRKWWFVTGWHHQLINRPTKSRYPLPPRHAPQPKAAGSEDSVVDVPMPAGDPQPEIDTDHRALTEDSLNAHGALTEDSLQEGKGKEGKGRERKGERIAAARPTRPLKTPLPSDLAITPELQTWATEHGYLENLQQHLDSFRDKATAKDYRYTDWTAALRNAIRDDWAGLRRTQSILSASGPGGGRITRRETAPPASTPQGAEFDAILRNMHSNRSVIEGEVLYAAH